MESIRALLLSIIGNYSIRYESFEDGSGGYRACIVDEGGDIHGYGASEEEALANVIAQFLKPVVQFGLVDERAKK